MDSNDTTAAASDYRAVFVATSLNTHIAICVSKPDTISDLKRMIALEHMQCFPKFGEIHIQSLKVKRRSEFYHLPDIMFVWNAFDGLKGNWFLSADVSSGRSCPLVQNLHLGTSANLMIEYTDGRAMSSDINGVFKSERPSEKTTDCNRDIFSEKPEARAKKKRKRLASSISEDQFNIEATKDNNHVGSIENSQNLLDSDQRKEKISLESIPPETFMTSKPGDELGQDVQTETLRGISDKVLDIPSGLMDNGVAVEDVNSDSSRRKTKKARRTTGEIVNEMPQKQTRNSENVNLYPETHKSEAKEEEKGLSLNQDHGLTIPSADTNAFMEPKVSGGNKKKRKKKVKREKSVATNLEKPSIVQTVSASSDFVFPSTDNHIQGGSDKEEGALYDKGQDVQMELLNYSDKAAGQKVKDANNDEADYAVGTQNSTTLEDVVIGEKVTEKNPKGDRHEDIPAVMRENHLDKDINKDKKVKKKRKKTQVGELDVQENLRVSVKKVDDHIRSEKERDLTSIYNTSVEKLVGMNETTFNAGDVGRTTENEGEKLNLEQLMDNGTAVEDVNSYSNRMKTKEVHKTTGETVNEILQKQTGNGENTNLYPEIHKSVEKEEEKGLSLNLDHGLAIPSDVNVVDNDSDLAQKENILPHLADANALAEPVVSGVNKKKGKKKIKKGVTSLATDVEKSSSGVVFSSTDNHIHGGTDKEEGSLYDKEQDVQMELLNNFDKVAVEKVQVANNDEADYAGNTESGKILEEAVTGEKITEPGNPHEYIQAATRDKDISKKVKKKRKKALVSKSNVQENLISSESVEKIEAIAATTFDTSDEPRTTEKEGEEINFKQFFLHCHDQDKVDSNVKEMKATNSTARKIGKKGEENKSSLDVSTELQNTAKSSENVENKLESIVNQDELVPDKLRIPLVATKEKKTSSKKSSPDMLKVFLENNKRFQSSLDATEKNVAKPQKKKSLLTKPGTIFEDNSGESSGDENGNVQFNTGTHSPSDNSSVSESAGESDLSQGSTGNGSVDSGHRTVGKKASKLDVSASKDMTMRMILRSSKRFKKAKLLASQNDADNMDSQEAEFVPDSQPI